jgi:hypothetical protein
VETNTKASFVVGKWQKVALYTRLNSKASTSDGQARLYLDGVLVTQRTNIKYRAVDGRVENLKVFKSFNYINLNYPDSSTLINTLYFSNFYGGSDPSWSPSKTTYIRYDNFAVYAGQIY